MNIPTQAKENPKKTYAPPRLVTYGHVRALTQAGSKGSAERGSTSKAKKAGSDRMIKENIVRIGVHPLGIGLYLFDYRSVHRQEWGHGRQFGVMADEVESVMPDAVLIHSDGYKMVDYAMLGITQHSQ